MSQNEGLNFAAAPTSYLAAWRARERHLRQQLVAAGHNSLTLTELRSRHLVARECVRHLPPMVRIVTQATAAPDRARALYFAYVALHRHVHDLLDAELHAGTCAVLDSCLRGYQCYWAQALRQLRARKQQEIHATTLSPEGSPEDLYHALPAPASPVPLPI